MSVCVPTCIPIILICWAVIPNPPVCPVSCCISRRSDAQAQQDLCQTSHSSSTLSWDKNRKWLMNSSPKHWLIKSLSSLKGANLPSTIASLLHRRQRQLNRTFNISPPLCSRREHGMFQDFDRTHYVDSGSKHNGLFTPHLVCGSPQPSILTLDNRDTRVLLETPSSKRS